jgi:SAM-dependent methyltransferase
MTVSVRDCYDIPGYWDLAFSDETIPEADFLEAVAPQFSRRPVRSVLDLGCGGGRQTLEMSKRGYTVTAIDLNPSCVKWTKRRLDRHKLSADVHCGDMADFTISRSVDLAHCLVNTFRHLTSEQTARQHLHCVAAALKPGALYVLGFHLLPPDAAEIDSERWTIRQGRTRVTTTIRVLDFSRRSRIETVRFSLKVTTPSRTIRTSTDHRLRIYRADQFRRLLRTVPEFELIGVYDFCYDPSEPLPFNDELGDAVFVLRRRD